jgi:hypothetical protein
MASFRERIEAAERARVASPKEKVADRPHRLTVVSWFLAPTVAAASIIFSLWASNRAVRISETSMKVSQRAYVAVIRVSNTLEYEDVFKDPDTVEWEDQISVFDTSPIPLHPMMIGATEPEPPRRP